MENLFFIILAALSLFVFFKLGKVKASKKQTDREIVLTGLNDLGIYYVKEFITTNFIFNLSFIFLFRVGCK